MGKQDFLYGGVHFCDGRLDALNVTARVDYGRKTRRLTLDD